MHARGCTHQAPSFKVTTRRRHHRHRHASTESGCGPTTCRAVRPRRYATLSRRCVGKVELAERVQAAQVPHAGIINGSTAFQIKCTCLTKAAQSGQPCISDGNAFEKPELGQDRPVKSATAPSPTPTSALKLRLLSGERAHRRTPLVTHGVALHKPELAQIRQCAKKLQCGMADAIAPWSPRGA